MNSPVGIDNICECLIKLRCRNAVDTYDWHVYVLLVNFNPVCNYFLKALLISLLILMGCFLQFRKVELINVTLFSNITSAN